MMLHSGGFRLGLEEDEARGPATADHHKGGRASDQHHLHRELLLGLYALALFALRGFPLGRLLDFVFGHARVP